MPTATFPSSTSTPRRVVALLALIVVACASAGGSGDGAATADEVSCDSLSACDDQQQCSDRSQCFKVKKCPGFVCAKVEVACKLECGSGACMVLESQPMMIGCR
jgi:hypothetical protein